MSSACYLSVTIWLHTLGEDKQMAHLTNNKVLIIDDEQPIVDNLTIFLERSGFVVESANNDLQGFEKHRSFQPNVIILDVMMPEMDGRQMLRVLRSDNDWTPVVLLTEVGNSTDRAMAITEGADDYLNKPYDPYELVARIQAILRRNEKLKGKPFNAMDIIHAGELTFDRKARIAKVKKHKLNLTPRGTHLLEYMMLHSNELLHRERILDAVWGWNFVTGTRSVDARVVELRKAIAEYSDTQFIETVPSEGYRFILDVY